MYKITKRKLELHDFLKVKNHAPFKKMRFNGKTVNLATVFACTGPTLGKQMKAAGFTESDCEATIQTFEMEDVWNQAKANNTKYSEMDLKYIIVGNKLRELFFQTYPGLLERTEREQKFALKHGYVRTWTGPIRHLPELRLVKRNNQGNLIGMDKKLYSKQFAGWKNEASNTTIQTAEVYQAMPDVTAINQLLEEWNLNTRIFNYVHDSICFYLYKPEKKLIYALLNQVSLEHRKPYYDLRMYIDINEADPDKDEFYDSGREVNIEKFDLKKEIKKWNEENGTNIEYRSLIPV